MGLDARGELLFPEEKRKENVELTEDAIAQLEDAVKDIQAISQSLIPPAPKKIGFCRNCAYRDFCWAEG